MFSNSIIKLDIILAINQGAYDEAKRLLLIELQKEISHNECNETLDQLNIHYNKKLTDWIFNSYRYTDQPQRWVDFLNLHLLNCIQEIKIKNSHIEKIDLCIDMEKIEKLIKNLILNKKEDDLLDDFNDDVFDDFVFDGKPYEDVYSEIKRSTKKENENKYFSKEEIEEYINRNFKYGSLTYNEGLLTLAQTNQRKTYDFNPIILKEEEFSEYLRILKTKPLPIREKFVFAGSHWLVGDIKIDEYGVNVYILDSLGDNDSLVLWPDTMDVIEAFNKEFPEKKIYFSKEKRQYGEDLSCYIYALDDVQHLHVIEAQLKAQGYSDIFDYLCSRKNKKGSMYVGDTSIQLCSMPLSLMRTMRSSKLFEVIKNRPNTEQEVLVNKKNQTVEESVIENFPEIRGKKNKRLDIKLEQMKNHNIEFMLNHSKEDIEKIKYEFTLAGFKKKVESQLINNKGRIVA